MCLAQGPQHKEAGEAELAAPRSRVKHSITEPLGFHEFNVLHIYLNLNLQHSIWQKLDRVLAILRTIVLNCVFSSFESLSYPEFTVYKLHY